MIIENNCVFLFKSDLIDEKKYYKIGDIEIGHFYKDDMNVVDFNKELKRAKIIVYIDSDKRFIKYFGKSPLKRGNLEKY